MRASTPPERVKVLADTLAKIAQTTEYKKFLEDQFADENSFIDSTKATEFIKEQLEDMKRAMLIN